MPERCHTCGGAVEIFTADEGTSSYRPVGRGALARERDELHPALIKVAYSHDSECSPALRHVARAALGLAACEPRQDCKACENADGAVDG
jgi:hypothetical protein